ncbi:uncharacterized protein CLUP02_05731 [Colletotrichum lupini]|uniref:Uncharacterized protein n=1 Tax=Colletotrichum lupini TaxID=145971 RepID=A0A9Q8SMR9_9PEZI|nr:uncharacterized protein CLUP02_05731 [Colletotrichum lupini]UQC80249.1 hypothetical protein CLUP02_05731 [Colletotrichum lupini]
MGALRYTTGCGRATLIPNMDRRAWGMQAPILRHLLVLDGSRVQNIVAP